MRKQQPPPPLVGVVFGVVVLLLVAFFASIRIVEPGHSGVVVRLGQAQEEALNEGIHFVLPFITKVHAIDIRIQKAEVKTAAASKDLQTINAEIAVNYRVDAMETVSLFRGIGRNYVAIVIEPAIQEEFKAGSAKYTAEDLITQRTIVSTEIREAISKRLAVRGVVIEAVNIMNFDFSAEFNRAIEEKMTAEQKAQQAERELERFKIEAQQKVETAKGEAEAVLEKAKAEAEALNLKSQYAKPELIWLTAVEKWDGKMPTHLFASPPMPVFETGSPPTNTTPRPSL